MKRARRMFKQIDCENIHETSQKVVAERAFGSTRDLQTLFSGNPSSQYKHNSRRSRRNKSMSYGINRHEPSGTRFSMSPMEELISVTRSRPQDFDILSQPNRHSKRGRKVLLINIRYLRLHHI